MTNDGASPSPRSENPRLSMHSDDLLPLVEAIPETLRQAERRFEALLEYSHEMVALLDRNGEWLYASPATKRQLGFDVEELTGRNAFDFVHPEDRLDAAATLAALAGTTAPVVAEARIRHKDGSWRRLEGTFHNLLRDPAVSAIVVNYRDVTDQRAAEVSHRRLQTDVTRIVDSTGVGIWELDLATGHLAWSEQTAAQMGMALADFDGRLETFFARVHPDDREKLQRAADTAIQQGGLGFDVEFRMNLPDGTTKWLENKGQVTYSGDGQPTHLGGVSFDISARKLLEHQLHQAQKLDALGRLAGGVAHDFNNLLTAILGFAEFVAGDLEPDDARLGDIGEITRAAQSATALTKQLLAFSRKQAIEPRTLNLNRVTNHAERMLRRLIGEDIDLSVRLGPEVRDIWADAGQIEQVLVNLAVNARDAMPNGGRLSIETSNAELGREYLGLHASVAPGPYVLLVVSDTGQGMSAEVQSRIFEPFFTTKAAGHGTGLGLATVYGIVKQSGGHVWVYSEEGHGTTFKVYFPRLDQKAHVDGPTHPSHPEDLTGHGTILLVEDNEQVRRLAVRALVKCGYDVLDAASPDHALAIATSPDSTIDLLVTDIVLPGMNGNILAEKLRERQPSLKCIFMSGYTGDVLAHHLTDHADAAFLQKPFTADSLARHVRDALSTP
jgi:two-component system cell cycle sensor histidine kinase/response regulator CckA